MGDREALRGRSHLGLAVVVIIFRDWWQIALLVVQVLVIAYGVGRGRTLSRAAKAFDETVKDYARRAAGRG
jgi:hypothetical protein